jgi:hypothetical protein
VSIQFFQTIMGKRFYEGQVPRIASALGRIADALEKQNELEAEAQQEKDDKQDETKLERCP